MRVANLKSGEQDLVNSANRNPRRKIALWIFSGPTVFTLRHIGPSDDKIWERLSFGVACSQIPRHREHRLDRLFPEYAIEHLLDSAMQLDRCSACWQREIKPVHFPRGSQGQP